jgi:hypothetical protein
MSDLAYFDYALVLPEERYLIEVQVGNPATGVTRGKDELQKLAKEALVTVVAKGRDDLAEKLTPTPISESDVRNLKKVQQLLSGPDCTVYLVE